MARFLFLLFVLFGQSDLRITPKFVDEDASNVRLEAKFRTPKIANGDADDVNLKIVNGNIGNHKQFPYQVLVFSRLNKKSGLMCGGAIANSKFVISAAHCVYNLNGSGKSADPSTVEVSVGLDSIEARTAQNTYRAKKIYVHQGFNEETLANDISIIELEQQIRFHNGVDSACFDLTDNLHGYLIGYGSVSTFTKSQTTDRYGKAPKQGNELKYAFLKENRHSREDCKDTFVCVESYFRNSGDSICLGDSGGPLTTDKGQVMGVASNVSGRRLKNGYDEFCIGVAAFTRLSQHLSFIDSIIGEDKYCSIRN